MAIIITNTYSESLLLYAKLEVKNFPGVSDSKFSGCYFGYEIDVFSIL